MLAMPIKEKESKAWQWPSPMAHGPGGKRNNDTPFPPEQMPQFTIQIVMILCNLSNTLYVPPHDQFFVVFSWYLYGNPVTRE